MIPALAVNIIELAVKRRVYHIHGVTDWQEICSRANDKSIILVHDHDVYSSCSGKGKNKRCHYEFDERQVLLFLVKMLSAPN